MSNAKGSTLGFAPALVIGKAQPKKRVEIKEIVIAEASFSVVGTSNFGHKNKQEGQLNDKS